MPDNLRPFHLAFPVRDLEETRNWYTDILECRVGRESDTWIDFNMFGHQIVAHLSENIDSISENNVDGYNIPIRHFGIILKPMEWKSLKEKFISKDIEFIIKPNTRFKGYPGEQSTMFIKDPSGNALEFKSFKDDGMLFKRSLN